MQFGVLILEAVTEKAEDNVQGIDSPKILYGGTIAANVKSLKTISK